MSLLILFGIILFRKTGPLSGLYRIHHDLNNIPTFSLGKCFSIMFFL